MWGHNLKIILQHGCASLLDFSSNFIRIPEKMQMLPVVLLPKKVWLKGTTAK